MEPNELPLRDIHLPDPVSLWPLAPGWWILAGILVLLCAWGVRLWLDYRHKTAARRYALQQFRRVCDAYSRHGNAVRLGSEMSELLRRTMLAYAPRTDVAGLTGERWLAWLDHDLDQPHFAKGDGRPLIEWPYRDPGTQVDRSDVAAFVDAVRLRLETPVGARS